MKITMAYRLARAESSLETCQERLTEQRALIEALIRERDALMALTPLMEAHLQAGEALEGRLKAVLAAIIKERRAPLGDVPIKIEWRNH